MELAFAELFTFVLAGFVGYQVITRVPPLLHTPLMWCDKAATWRLAESLGGRALLAPHRVHSVLSY